MFFKNKSFFIYIIFVILIFVSDLLTKKAIFALIDSYTDKGYIHVTSFFDLVKVNNRGISFGLLNNIEYGRVLLSIAAIIIAIFLLVWLYKEQKDYFKSIALVLIIGGAVGNIVDRIVYGSVADFLYFHIGSYYWPAFNLADSCVCLGVFLLVIEPLYKKYKLRRVSTAT